MSSESAESADGEDIDADVIDHSDETFDAADVMGGNADAETETATAEAVVDSDDGQKVMSPAQHVRQAASMVSDGIIAVDELTVPDRLASDDHDLEWFKQEVREEVADSGTSTVEKSDGPDVVDWRALWDEFGFDTPDATGRLVISETQLLTALESSEQGITGGLGSKIESAVENNTLVECESKGSDNEMHLRGYRLVGVDSE
jgi:hypothetical protein